MILITGAQGQLGQELGRKLPAGSSLLLSSADLDITSEASWAHWLAREKITAVINCAAYTQVDRAEDHVERARMVNAKALLTIGRLTSKFGIKVVHFSSDYVFDGTSSRPYREDDVTCPLGVYGTTKLEGEKLLLESNEDAVVIRTSWVYSRTGNNFVNSMLRLAGQQPNLRVVFDQVGTPTYAADLASAALEILPSITSGTPKILNYSNEGVTSWYDFAKAIFELKQLNVSVIPIRTEEYPTRAHRPSYSVLDKTLIKQTLGLQIPHWRESLKTCLELS